MSNGKRDVKKINNTVESYQMVCHHLYNLNLLVLMYSVKLERKEKNMFVICPSHDSYYKRKLRTPVVQ